MFLLSCRYTQIGREKEIKRPRPRIVNTKHAPRQGSDRRTRQNRMSGTLLSRRPMNGLLAEDAMWTRLKDPDRIALKVERINV